MFKTYLTRAKLLEFFPNLAAYREDDDTFSNEIGAAEQIVRQDLRNRGYKLEKIYIPLMLKDNVQPYERWSETVGITSPAYASHNESLLVVDCLALNGEATVNIEGSNDSSTWYDITTVSLTTAGIETYNLPVRWKNYRYVSTITTSATWAIYITDAAVETAMAYKVASLVTQNQIAKGESQKTLYDSYEATYQQLLSALAIDYDSDDSGSIEDEDTAKPRTILVLG